MSNTKFSLSRDINGAIVCDKIGEHTPMPWTKAQLQRDDGQTVYTIVHKGDVVCETSKEDAAFIAKACNNYDELVGALLDIMLWSIPQETQYPWYNKVCSILTKVKS